MGVTWLHSGQTDFGAFDELDAQKVEEYAAKFFSSPWPRGFSASEE